MLATLMLADPTAFGTIYARSLGDLHTFDETGRVPHSCESDEWGRTRQGAPLVRNSEWKEIGGVPHSCEATSRGRNGGVPHSCEATSGKEQAGAPFVRSDEWDEAGGCPTRAKATVEKKEAGAPLARKQRVGGGSQTEA